MRQEFFTLKPSEKSPPQPLTSLNLDTGMQSMFETDSDGVQIYRVRFDVSEFQPEEIQVSSVFKGFRFRLGEGGGDWWIK